MKKAVHLLDPARAAAATAAAACGLALLTAASVGAQSAGIDALQVSFTTTQFSKTTSTPTIVESGTYIVGADGRRRIEKVDHRTNERSVEIIDYQNDRHVILDPARRTATSNGTHVVPVPPAGSGKSYPAGAPSGLHSETVTTRLGTRTVGTLVLEGTRFTTTHSGDGRLIVHTNETWIYRFANPRIVPLIMEQRFEGDDQIVETRVDSAISTRVPASTFDVPSGFAISHRE